jgi:uncharacterized damage-inducible protein DinB
VSAADFNRARVEEVYGWLASLPEVALERIPAPGGWSPKQVLGHLIDSACNNHARWARIAGQDGLLFPTWDQDGWNAAQDWQHAPWPELLALWHSYNLHLARFQSLLTPEALAHTARIGRLNGGEPMTLAELLEHYERHLSHHLAQIRERAGEP